MKQRIIFSVVAVFLLLSGGSAYRLLQNRQFRKTIAVIPEFCLPAADRSLFCKSQLEQGKPVVLMYIDPGCDLCRTEVQQLIKKAEQAADIQWVLAAPVPPDTLGRFASAYHLTDVQGIIMVSDTAWTLHERLQAKGIPSCYVYNQKHQLVKTVQGLVRLETVIKAATSHSSGK